MPRGQRGGCGKNKQGGCGTHPFHFSLSLFGFFVLDRTTRTAPAERERTGATPTFSPLARFGEWGGVAPRVARGVAHPPRLRGGRSRLNVSLREGSPARTRAGRRAATSGAMLDRLLRAFLIIGGVSAACAWTWPGVFPETDPVAVLVRYHTPNVYAAVVAWYYVAPGVAALHGRAIPHQHIADLVRQDGRQSGAPLPPSDAGRFRLRRMGRRSSSARSITRSAPSRARPPHG